MNTSQKQQFVSFLESLAGTGAISMQFTEIKGTAQIQPGAQGQPNGAIYQINQQTGKWLGGVGADTWWYGSTEVMADTSFVDLFNEYWAAGGIATLTMSMPNPVTGGPSSDTTAVDFSTLPNNPRFMAALSSVADALAQVNGLVMFRPFHEANGPWFWWSGIANPAAFIALCQFVHTYITVTRGLTNVVFLWAVNAGFSTYPPMPLYPGDAYVDVVGLDVYSSNPAGAVADYQALVAMGKPVMLCEFGSGSPSAADANFQMPTLIAALKSNMPKVVAWQQWWAPWGMETAGGLSTALTDPWVKNRGDLAALFAPPPPPPPTIPAAVQTEINAALTALSTLGAQLTNLASQLRSLL